MNLRSAVAAIEKRGVLLVYPIENRKDLPSLWSHFFPRSRMAWAWDSGADNRVAELWRLREELSRSGKVAYAKWFRGRATFFSLPVLSALLKILGSTEVRELPREAAELLRHLEWNSPLSTKELKRAAGIEGRFQEKTYTAAMKALWSRLLVVGFGEVDDGAFPSLAMGATRLMFEAAWAEAERLDPGAARSTIARFLPEGSAMRCAYEKLLERC